MKANEARLVELNTIAERLTAMGQTEAAEKIRIQIEDLNQRWAALQQVTQERAQTLGSAHEVQRYHRCVSLLLCCCVTRLFVIYIVTCSRHFFYILLNIFYIEVSC